MDHPDSESFDRNIMQRCIALSRISGEAGEYPYGAVICREGMVIAESINRVTQDGDITRHAEVVVISAAQKLLSTTSLDDCTLYASAEPCAFCCYAIRESRIKRVVYGMRSPHMGGVSKWNVLADEDISDAMPEVFAPPPEIVAGFMGGESEEALIAANPVVWGFVKRRGLFGGVASPEVLARENRPVTPPSVKQQLMAILRRLVFDRIGRR